MAASIYPPYPPALSPAQSDYLLSNIKDWSILNGLAVRPSPAFIPKDVEPSGSLAVTAPVALFPSLFPRACFEEARAIQTAYNELYALIASDEGWLQQVVEEYASPESCFHLLRSQKKRNDSLWPTFPYLVSNSSSFTLPNFFQISRGG